MAYLMEAREEEDVLATDITGRFQEMRVSWSGVGKVASDRSESVKKSSRAILCGKSGEDLSLSEMINKW